MTCPQCGDRKGKRACPALGETICSVCCATKRLVSIRCPRDCAHLASAKAHPAASVRRQQASDLRTLLDGMPRLSEGQLRLLFLVLSYLCRPAGPGRLRLTDAEAADAAAAVAATFDTASRGVIYEHQATSVAGQQAATELVALLRDAGKGGGSRFEREVAEVLGGVARAAAPPPLSPPGGRAYLDLVVRVLQDDIRDDATVDPPSLILP